MGLVVSGLGLRVLSLGPSLGGLGLRDSDVAIYTTISRQKPFGKPVVGAMNLDSLPHLKGLCWVPP